MSRVYIISGILTQTINIWSSIIMYYVNWFSSYVGGKNVEN